MRVSPEKKALFGLFFVGIFVVVSTIYVGKKNLWFDKKLHYFTVIKDADGLEVGSLVTLSGLKVGEVVSLRVDRESNIEVKLSVTEKLAEKIREDTVAKVIRAFVIGKKRIELTPGSSAFPMLPDKGRIIGEDSTELTDLLGGKNISLILDKVEKLADRMEGVFNEFERMDVDEKSSDLIKTYNLLHPTLHNMNQLTLEFRKQLLDNQLITKSLGNINAVVAPVARREVLIEGLLDNVQSIVDEINKTDQIGSSLITALRELIVTLQAIQKTWILEDHVEELKEKRRQKAKEEPQVR